MTYEPAPYPPVDGTQPCAAEDPEIFFSDSRDNYWKQPRAMAACRRCPFRRPCLAYGLTHAVGGVWGGATEAERARLRQQHDIRAVPIVVTDLEALHRAIALLDRGGVSAAEIALRLGCSTKAIDRFRARTRDDSQEESA